MSVLDLDKLLSELSEDAPCGEDLEYDPAFSELERATQGKLEQQFGDTIVPAEEPNWKDVKRVALEILGRTRDLRVAAHLTRAIIRQDGLPGLADGLGLFRGYLEQLWETVHPQLDPDDANDPTMRVNAILQLCAPEKEFQSGTTLRFILDCPIISNKVMGSFSLHDIEIASGSLPKPPDMDEVPDLTVIDGMFAEIELDELTATADLARTAIENAQAIDTTLTELVGTAEAPNLAELHQVLGQIGSTLDARLSARGVVTTGGGAADKAPAAAGGAPGAVAAPRAIAGEIQSREDVTRMIDKIIEYFVRNEPSSPVPMLLNRAKRLVSKSFAEIIQDLAPTGLPEVQKISGTAAQ